MIRKYVRIKKLNEEWEKKEKSFKIQKLQIFAFPGP